MKFSIALLFLFFNYKINAQEKKSINIFSLNNAIVISPLALFEPNATLDIGYIHSFNTKSKVLINAGVLLPFNFYKGELPFNKGGYRITTQLRYYNIKKELFYGAEFKYRQVAFDNVSTPFINTITKQTSYLDNPNAKASIFATAIIVGFNKPISKNNKFIIDFSTGLGIRFKKVVFKETTSTLLPNINFYRRPILPGKNESATFLHFPLAFRVVYLLN